MLSLSTLTLLLSAAGGFISQTQAVAVPKLSNAELIARGQPIHAPASFEKRMVNGQIRSLPGSHTESSLRRRQSPSVYDKVGYLRFQFDSDPATNWYVQNNDPVYGSYGIRAIGDESMSAAYMSLTYTGSSYNGLKAYFMTPDATGAANFGPYMCMASNSAQNDDTGTAYMDGCQDQNPAGAGPDSTNGLSSAQHPYHESLFLVDPNTNEVTTMWINSDGTTYTGGFNSFINLLEFNPNGQNGVLYIVPSVV